MVFDRTTGGHRFAFGNDVCVRCGISRAKFEHSGSPRCTGPASEEDVPAKYSSREPLRGRRAFLGFFGGGLIQMCTAAGWIHEIKYGGFRIIARRDAAGVCLVTRNGYNFADRFPLIVAAIAALPASGGF